MTGWVLLLWTAVAGAQQLDLRVPPVAGGTVYSIREIYASPQSVAPKGSGPQAVGAPSDIEAEMPVGAVVARPFGSNTTSSEHKWRFGAAGTADMQQRLARSRYELVVNMDDGERRAFQVDDIARFRVGQRVSVRSGEVEPLGD